MLGDQGAAVRGTAILAFRDVFTGTDITYNKYLRPIVIDVLMTSLRDPATDNRRAALNTFNAASRNKPDLIFPYMQQLFPLVLDQTLEDPSLVREVSMGPFKHKVDDGLEVRKVCNATPAFSCRSSAAYRLMQTAYETLYSLLELAPSRLDLQQLFSRVVAGLGDEHSIRTLCNLMLLKLGYSAPEETALRLDDIADKYRAVLATQLKENAVKHEHEKNDEAKRSAVKVSLELARSFPDRGVGDAGKGIKWISYLQDMGKDHAALVKEVEKEVKERGGF